MKVRQWAVALPGYRVTAGDIAQWTGAEENFLTHKVGISERHYLGADETVTGLAAKACRNLFDLEPELELSDIRLLVLVTQNPDYPLPHTSAILQEELGLDNRCACFDISLGCSGYVYALSVAKGFMEVQGLDNALIVTADPYSKIMHRHDKNTMAVFGDAAAATWLSAESGATLGLGDFGTDGSGAESLILRYGGSAHPHGGIWNQEPRTVDPRKIKLHMNGRAIFNFMMKRIPDSIQACLHKNNLTMDEVDIFAFHQASRFLLEGLRDRLKLPKEKVPLSLNGYGNTISSTIPILLSELNAEGRLTGKTVLVSGFGVGLSWGTNIMKFLE